MAIERIGVPILLLVIPAVFAGVALAAWLTGGAGQ